MSPNNTLPYGRLGAGCAHLCVDMQNMFAEETAWKTPWMKRVLPRVRRLAEAHAARTVFTRFIPPRSAEDAYGTWRRYYERWSSITASRLDPVMLDLVPALAALAPPARVIDKRTYSPFLSPELGALLRDWHIDTLVISGTETDVCVLASVLAAVDLGYRVVVASDALCSSADATHDALMKLYHDRFGQQIETAIADVILANWE
jgi:nicotinamidase-related amidase